MVASDESEGPPSDSEDEEALEEQELFERRYNFRFEEPDGNLVSAMQSMCSVADTLQASLTRASVIDVQL